MPRSASLLYVRGCFGEAPWSWNSPSLSSDKDPSTCPSFPVNAESWFCTHTHLAHGSGIPITLSAPGECFPSNINHVGRVHKEPGTQHRQGGMQGLGGGLASVGSPCAAVHGEG